MEKFTVKINKIISSLKSIKNKSYIFSRFVSSSVKPLLLFICLFFDYTEFGIVIAMVFLVSSFNLMLFSIPIFRDHFINYFDSSNLKRKYYSKKYKSEIVIIFLFSIIFLIPLNKFFEKNIKILICSFLIYTINKVYDEIQRLLIFKKKFSEWSTITNLKNFTLFIFFLSPIFQINIVYLGVIYFIINCLKLFTYIKISFNLKLKKKIIKLTHSLWDNRKIYLINYFLLFYTIGDKVLIGKNYKDSLTEYVFLSNILSIPLLFIFFFYISKYKTEFVKNQISLNQVFFSKELNYLLIFSFLLVFFVIGVFYVFNIYSLSIVSLVFLSLIYITKSFGIILDEIVYWKSFYKNFLFFEFLFFLFFLFISLFIINTQTNIESFLALFLILVFSKLILKILFLKRNMISKSKKL